LNLFPNNLYFRGFYDGCSVLETLSFRKECKLYQETKTKGNIQARVKRASRKNEERVVLATPVYLPFNHMTWQLAGEYFIESIIAYGEILNSHRTCLVTRTWVHPEFIVSNHFNFICIWKEASISILPPLFSAHLIRWEARFCIHNEQYSQQNKILKLSRYSDSYTYLQV
jgi:hypothetical protein